MSLCTLVLMIVPIGFSFAQDYEAVIERLKQAVDAKEISPEQAKAMIAVLKKSSIAKSPQAKTDAKKVPAKPGGSAKPLPKKDASQTKLDWDAITKKIESAVKAGKLTREQADARYDALKKQADPKPAAKKAPAKPGSSAKPLPKKDVSQTKLDWDAIAKKIESAVKAGKLTREQADAKYDELKKQADSKPAVKKAPAKPKAVEPAKPAKQKKPQ
ncbi:MAG: hypothetical protein VX738_09635 [Planctomycetota bacterium]|nr:hypothetical protein [Planctomycetota bacterium]